MILAIRPLSCCPQSSHRHIVSKTSCHRAPIGPRNSLRAVGTQSWLLPSTWSEKPCRKRFPDRLAARRQRPALPWVPPPSHPPNLTQCAQSVPSHPTSQVSWFHSFEEPFDVLFNHTTLGQLHKHLRQRNWAKLSWARLRHLLPWLRFLGTQSSGAIVAAVHSFAVQCGTIALVQVPNRSRNTAGPNSVIPIAAMSALRQPQSPGSAASTTPLAIRFTNFAGGGREFPSSLLEFLTSQSRVRQFQQQPVSVPQQRFACSAARAHWSAGSAGPPECYLKHASSAFSVAKTMLSFAAFQASVPHHPLVRHPVRPAQAAGGPTRPIGMQQPQPGGIQDHAAWPTGDDNACDVATAS